MKICEKNTPFRRFLRQFQYVVTAAMPLGFSPGAAYGTPVSAPITNDVFNLADVEGKTLYEVMTRPTGSDAGVTPPQGSLPSAKAYRDYLKSLGDYLYGTEDPAGLWKSILAIITSGDGSPYRELSDDAGSVATGFLKIYAAELRAHATNRVHPTSAAWGNDLLEATLVSLFVQKNGGFLFAGKSVRGKGPLIIRGGPENFFGIGRMGSRIGTNRMERRALQNLLTETMELRHPDLVGELRRLTGAREGDVIRGLAEFLNHPKNQELVRERAEELGAALGKFMEKVRTDATIILAHFTFPGLEAPTFNPKFKSAICGGYLKK